MKCHTERLFHTLTKYTYSKSLLSHDDTPKSANYLLLLKRKAHQANVRHTELICMVEFLRPTFTDLEDAISPSLVDSSNTLTGLLFLFLEIYGLNTWFLKVCIPSGISKKVYENARLNLHFQDCCCTSAQASVACAFERIAGDSQRENSETLL